jgi:hypothetical protein
MTRPIPDAIVDIEYKLARLEATVEILVAKNAGMALTPAELAVVKTKTERLFHDKHPDVEIVK